MSLFQNQRKIQSEINGGHAAVFIISIIIVGDWNVSQLSFKFFFFCPSLFAEYDICHNYSIYYEL